MATPRLATYSIAGAIRYGAVTDTGIVDLSARFGKEFPTLREAIAAVNRLASPADPAPVDRAGGRVLSRAGPLHLRSMTRRRSAPPTVAPSR